MALKNPVPVVSMSAARTLPLEFHQCLFCTMKRSFGMGLLHLIFSSLMYFLYLWPLYVHQL